MNNKHLIYILAFVVLSVTLNGQTVNPQFGIIDRALDGVGLLEYDGSIYLDVENPVIDFNRPDYTEGMECGLQVHQEKYAIDFIIIDNVNATYYGNGYFVYNLTLDDVDDLTIGKGTEVFLECYDVNGTITTDEPLIYEVTSRQNEVNEEIEKITVSQEVDKNFFRADNMVNIGSIMLDVMLYPLRVMFYFLLFLPVLLVIVEIFIVALSINEDPIIFLKDLFNNHIAFYVGSLKLFIYLMENAIGFSVGILTKIIP